VLCSEENRCIFDGGSGSAVGFFYLFYVTGSPVTSSRLTSLCLRRGCAAFVGRDINKLKTNGKGKFKYMAENEMLELAEKFRPYRYV
jgi:hypothetical protein